MTSGGEKRVHWKFKKIEKIIFKFLLTLPVAEKKGYTENFKKSKKFIFKFLLTLPVAGEKGYTENLKKS